MASSFDIGTGFVSVVLSAKGIKQQAEDEIGNPIKEGVESKGDEAQEGFFSNFKSGGAKAAGVAGVALGALLSKGFMDSVGAEAGNDNLTAQLGIKNPEYAADLGKIAGKTYSNNFGENLGQVNEALKKVIQNGLLPEDAVDADIQRITEKALTLNDVFGQDLTKSTKAVAQLIKTGLVKDADEGFDIITRGIQQGTDVSEDFLDTLNEYPIQFQKLGLDAATATGILSQGMKAGARDSDVVADSLKEFSIRAIDGSKLTAEGFAAIGLSGEDMAKKIAAGGTSAAEGLDQTLDALRNIEDPVARNAAAVALFGTQAEDLGAALFELDPSNATKALGDFEGAAAGAAAIVGDNTQAKLETFKRKIETAFSGVASSLGPVLSAAPALAGVVTIAGGLGPVFSAAASGAKLLGSGILSLGKVTASLAVSAAKAVASTVAQTAAWVAQKAVTTAVSAVTKAYTAIQAALNIVMSLNPIGLVVLAIAGLIAAFILAYQHIEPFRAIVDAVFSALAGAVKFVIDFVAENWPKILAILTGPIGIAVLLITKHWDTIKEGVSAFIKVVFNLIEGFVNFFKELPGKIINAIGNFASLLYNKGVELIQGLINGYIAMWTHVINFYRNVATAILGFIGNLGSTLYNKGIELIQGLINGAQALINAGFGFIRDIGSTVANSIGYLGNYLYNAGGDLIRGLINGIRSVASNLTEVVLAPVRNAVNGVKNFLGIGSPSKLFMKIGADTMEGFQIGIDKNPPDFNIGIPDVNALASLKAPFTNLASIGSGRTGPASVVINNQNNTNADPGEIAAATAFRLITSGAL